jgi:hypothetical protein
MTGPVGEPSVPAGRESPPGTPGARRPGASQQARDRDPAGRPRNARPRDGLGRPLSRGQTGEERIPDDLAVPPDEALSLAQRLLDSGRPFHAHEVLEASWKAAPPTERELWKGLAQIAVGLTHARRGNATGAAALLRRGGQRVGGYAGTAPHGIDAAAIARQAASLADRIDAGDLTAAAGDGADFRLT